MSAKVPMVASIATSICLIFTGATGSFASDYPECDEDHSAITQVAVENGGVIILHTIYRPCDEECGYSNFVMVAPDHEVDVLRAQFAHESDLRIVVRVKDDTRRVAFDAQLAYTDGVTFTGMIVSSGESFVVVGQRYARQRGWL
jgi:hypothetical protein